MSEILIFRYEPTGGPGYFGQYLDRRQIPYRVLEIDQGETVPDSIDGVSGLVFMGGGMSVNDDLEWIPKTLHLIRIAQFSNVPMLGHCLGGQLIAKALGGSVTKNPVEEIGWFPVATIIHDRDSRDDDEIPSTFDVFQWHNETFSLPTGARHLFYRETCPHQGFKIGNSLALQFHLEITPQIVDDWSARFITESHKESDTVQTWVTMLENLTEKSRNSNAVADKIYHSWCRLLT